MRTIGRPIPTELAEAAATDCTVVESGCWETNWKRMEKGYGATSRYSRDLHRSDTYLAHRAAWTFHNGPIPAELVIDHMCFNRACVNPEHLRAITLAENTRRREGAAFPLGQCKYGHPLSDQVEANRLGRVQHFCGRCMADRNTANSAIKKNLRQLEIAFGAGDWHTKGIAYKRTLNEREARRKAIRDTWIEEAA